MSDKIYIGVAWPYANGSLSLGHIAGANLPADIFARYHRAKGHEVIMVSGSDQHGTPITLEAEKQGKTPQEIVDRCQQEFIDCWQKMGISWDLYTSTGTKNHFETSQNIFLRLLEQGYLYKETISQFYCPRCQRFLADRYVEGKCPSCGAEGARGDQCDACSKPLNATELISPYCRVCKTTPVLKDTEHFFLKLSAFQERLEKWAEENKDRWRPNVYGLTMRYLKEGLRDRAITRDIDWGIPVPVKGYETKRLYVWFEAVIGYLSASKQWAKEIAGDENKWKDFWENPEAKSYYFLGKDNIPFHTIIWPAILLGYGGLNLPTDVPANEFLNIEAKKISKSHHWGVWLPDYLSRYDPDPLRYLLSTNMPETSDMDFTWRDYVRRNNDELVATWGNLVNRVLTFTYKNYNGCVPENSKLNEAGIILDNKAQATEKQVDALLAGCHFKQAIHDVMALAHEANRYLDEQAPWKKIKEDKKAAGDSLYSAICVISRLKNMFYPFLPFTSQKTHEYLGYEGKLEDYLRANPSPALPAAGQKLNEPKPLFTKLEESIIEEETKRIGS
jgi:methionyl-tRNA synthetase